MTKPISTLMAQRIDQLSAQAQREMMAQHTTWLKAMDAARDAARAYPPKPAYSPSRVTRRRMDVVMIKLGVATWTDAEKLADTAGK